jgi:UDP-N-acetylmuramoyl-tripeptide--D-alanyl-D-alanine ligase
MTTSSNTIWTSTDADRATGGRSTHPWAATGISIDSRTVKPGDLFVALKGEHGDGHDHIADALKRGAAAAMVSFVPDEVGMNAPLLVLPDTLTGLQDLGRASRARSGATIIAVTGSVGKTGTKEMLAAAFGALGQVHAAQASYNNHWGVPFTLSGMHAGSDFGIYEIGMNHAGEITPLTQQVRPDIAIITTIAPVHLEHFDSVEQIADAKAEIFDGMQPGSVAILNQDNAQFNRLKAKAEQKGLKVLSFGEQTDADCRMVDCLNAANGTRMKAQVMDEEITVSLQIPGRHIAQNVLAVLLAVKIANGDLKKAAEALAKVEPIKGRGRREYIDIGDPDNPVTLIDESYNASPDAMRAAFKVLALIDPGRGGRRIAILGDMRELGKDAGRLHAELAMPLQAAGVQLVYTSGPLMKNLYDALPQDRRGRHEDDIAKLAEIVPDVLVPGDVVMVKGSRGGGPKPRMQVMVEALRAMPKNKKDQRVV